MIGDEEESLNMASLLKSVGAVLGNTG